MYHRKSRLIFLFFFINQCLFFGCIKKSVPVSSCYKSENFIIHRKSTGDTYPFLAQHYLNDRNRAETIKKTTRALSLDMNRFIIIPVKEKHLGGIYLSGYQTIPVLCYHKFNEKDDSKLNISKQAFEEQIKYLKDNEFRSITLKALLDFFEYKKEIPEKSVLITIDDGFKSGYDVACQILLKYGFKAVFFIYTDYVGVSGKAMTWENLRELKKNGFEIGSHTLSHCDLTEQFQGESEEAYQKRIKREIWMSKKIIDKKLNQNTVSFSFPYGKSNPEVVDYVRSAGYKMGFTVTQGSNPFFSDTFTLKRYMILNSNKESFISKLRVFQPLY